MDRLPEEAGNIVLNLDHQISWQKLPHLNVCKNGHLEVWDRHLSPFTLESRFRLERVTSDLLLTVPSILLHFEHWDHGTLGFLTSASSLLAIFWLHDVHIQEIHPNHTWELPKFQGTGGDHHQNVSYSWFFHCFIRSANSNSNSRQQIAMRRRWVIVSFKLTTIKIHSKVVQQNLNSKGTGKRIMALENINTNGNSS